MKKLKNFEPKQNFVLLRGKKKSLNLELAGQKSQDLGVDKYLVEKTGDACSEKLEIRDEVIVLKYQDKNGQEGVKGVSLNFPDSKKEKDDFLLVREQEIIGVFKPEKNSPKTK